MLPHVLSNRHHREICHQARLQDVLRTHLNSPGRSMHGGSFVACIFDDLQLPHRGSTTRLVRQDHVALMHLTRLD